MFLKSIPLILRFWIVLSGLTFCFDAEAVQEVEESELPHSFLLPRGVPEKKNSYHIQVSPFLDQTSGVTTPDIGGHLSYGLFDWGGIHLRSLGARTSPNAEIIGLIGLIKNQEHTQGISLLTILAIPTNKKPGQDHSGLGYLVGLASRLTPTNNIVINPTLHYDFTAMHVIPELGMIYRLSSLFYSVLDSRASLGSGGNKVDLLPGMKLRIGSHSFLGVGYRFPVTTLRDFDRQIYFQYELMSH